MIDYKNIGSRIRAVRLEKMTQEQLAEAAGVGVAHISHIENGVGIPSVQALVDIINALDCSADELLCVDAKKARPHLDSWLSELVADCSDTEVKLICDMVVSIKASLRRLKISEE